MKKTAALMLVGTSSDAGKSFLTAVILRHYAKRGLKVAPFKAQNMSRLSYSLPDGRIMADSQRQQADAVGIRPRVEMNPILLRPLGDRKSELIVLGESQGQYFARDYYAEKSRLRPLVLSAYESLARDSDLIVVEGAGSCAEINLLTGDYVNLGLARELEIPALLVADIERGGVFASIYGHYKILPAELGSLLHGFLINRFRGDVSILEAGIREIEEKLETPCLGVVPYIEAYLEAEDSLSENYHRLPPDIQEKLQAPEERAAFYRREFERAAEAAEAAIRFELIDAIIDIDHL